MAGFCVGNELTITLVGLVHEFTSGFPRDVPWTISISCEFSSRIERVRYFAFVIYDSVVWFHNSFTDMGKAHVRSSVIECFVNVFCIVSFLTSGVQSEKTYPSRPDSSAKKIKNDIITVPLAVNIWKPYTQGMCRFATLITNSFDSLYITFMLIRVCEKNVWSKE